MDKISAPSDKPRELDELEINASTAGLFRVSNESATAYAARMRAWQDDHRSELITLDFAADQGITVEVTRYEAEGFWRIGAFTFATTDARDSSRSDQITTARALIGAGEALLALNKRTPPSPVDEAVAVEVRALAADREWTLQNLADELGWSMARLSSRLCGYSRWSFLDVAELATLFEAPVDYFVPGDAK